MTAMQTIPLLLIPGLLCDGRLWRDQIAGLSDVAAATVADTTQDDRVEAMAARAVAAMPPGPFALAGLSMGGYIALAVMRHAPERVERLCLMDTSAQPESPLGARRRRGLIALSRTGRFHGVTPRLLVDLLHPDSLADPEIGEAVMEMAQRLGRDVFIRQETAIVGRPDSRPDLPGIGIPTLVVVGDQDRFIPIDQGREIADLIPGAQFRIVAGSGHLPPMEQPAATTLLMREWLSGRDNSA